VGADQTRNEVKTIASAISVFAELANPSLAECRTVDCLDKIRPSTKKKRKSFVIRSTPLNILRIGVTHTYRKRKPCHFKPDAQYAEGEQMNHQQLKLRELGEADEAAFLRWVEDWRGEERSWATFVWTPGMSHQTHLQNLKDEKDITKIASGRGAPSTVEEVMPPKCFGKA